MRKGEHTRKPQPWRPHWSDSIWLVIVPVAILAYYYAGIASAAMASLVTVFIVIGVRSQVSTSRERHHHQRRMDEGFWNH